jgi:general secretion pathway protein D
MEFSYLVGEHIVELKTDVSLVDGDVIILGGMTETKDSGGSAGMSFLPAFMRSKTASSSKSEIILVLQLTRI